MWCEGRADRNPCPNELSKDRASKLVKHQEREIVGNLPLRVLLAG